MELLKDDRDFLVNLAGFIKDYPDVLKFSLEYFREKSSPWSMTAIEPYAKRIKMAETQDDTQVLLEIVYQYLQTFSNYFRNSWEWSQFIDLFEKTEDFYLKWMFCQCLSTVLYMTENRRHSFIRKYLSDVQLLNNELIYLKKEMAGELSLSECILMDQDKIAKDYKKLLSIREQMSDTVDIEGIRLSLVGESVNSSLVLFESTIRNLKGLALAVSIGKAVSLCGPVGCGKTALVQHLAAVTGHSRENRLFQVQLGEEMDSKLLLGSYKCTDLPGEFVWQSGVLTKAVIGGDWVLFEDIDVATNDVIALLISLIERNSLNVPGYRDNIIPAPGFQLFFTQRIISSVSGYIQQNITTVEALRKYWLQLNVEPLTRAELEQLISVKFPVLSTIANKMVDVFLKFSIGSHESKNETTPFEICDIFGPRGRLTSTRDLLKWCSRSVIGYDVTSQNSALLVINNGIDIFCCNVADPDIRLQLATEITTSLGVVKEKAMYFCREHKPSIDLDKNRCVAGRAVLERYSTLIDAPATTETSSKLYFATTKPACCLMERVACCLSLKEPVLLVGETGTGKTSTLQLLAKHTGNTLVVLNMNQQSDSSDLLGGYKPVDVKYIIAMLRDEFEELFNSAFTLVPGNVKFLNHISNCFNSRDWNTLIQLMKHVRDTMLRKTLSQEIGQIWHKLGDKLERLSSQLKHNRALAFAFIEGALIKAIKQGHWVLLDEINLASAETLQCLSGLLEDEGTLSLYEKGEFEPIKRHPNFRLMAAMNPATDVGKKQLPSGIRNRFTEFFVDELTDEIDLIILVACYLRELAAEKINAIAKFYMKVRFAAQTFLNDGTGHKPHYSLRTLCRALSIVAANPGKNIKRSLYEGFCLSFLTQLDLQSHEKVEKMIISRIILGIEGKPSLTLTYLREKIKNVAKQPIPEPEPFGSHISFQGYWISRGNTEVTVSEKYVLTESVTENLKDLVRIVSMSCHPILIQGDTSVGKTSLILYLGSASGNKCLRVNNHEHTDLQEYIGAYSVDEKTGQLVFKEGVLVEAMRHGYWIILDELNLAPSDVLEALNRVLDDNRELYIPETQVTVKADIKFRLFATQNPTGLYGGRKVLSRAFRNRFIELHFSEIPEKELVHILHKRCQMPESYTKKIVAVMKELQMHRRGSATFAGKHGFITLRDLFRWGERYRLASASLSGEKFYDWDQHIADEGYLVLAGRVRKPEEAEIITRALEKHIRRKVDVNNLFTLNQNTSLVTKHILETITNAKVPGFEHLVWTYNIRKLAVLLGKAIEFQEPVLVVGETGCGKTTICQFIAMILKQKLLIVNCHQHSESSDFLGGLRPVRQCSGKKSNLFEWEDGPLIEAMKQGHMFLADEISLADDSVLERMNSLLEPERTLLLSEKSGSDFQLGEVVVAHPSFCFLSTMNPGGDYGKKELSPALRNRLTEIWSESCTNREDLLNIIEHNIKSGLSFGYQEDGTSGIGKAILNFIDSLQNEECGKRIIWSIRDLLLWVKFINKTTEGEENFRTSAFTKLTLPEAYMHGAHLVFLDRLGIGSNTNYQESFVKSKRESLIEYMKVQFQKDFNPELSNVIEKVPKEYFGIHPFYIKKGSENGDKTAPKNFTFQAKTTRENLVRLLRSLQLPERAILLEGSPGVGKTSLVQALADAAGHRLSRINLSEQTDVSDLFGADLPVDGADGGVFAWRDGPFLRALKDGHWILLDELNLASQSVLEGLNAVLDHRGELFIPELNRSFVVKSSTTRLFACQNPLRQGGARKGLPASFLNRFTQVYMEPLSQEDILFVIETLYPEIPSDLTCRMVHFNSILASECGAKWGLRGAPWELNLRDMMRWCQVMMNYPNGAEDPGRFVGLLYVNRMRTVEDRNKVKKVYEKIFEPDYPLLKANHYLHVTRENITIGDITLSRKNNTEKGLPIDKRDSNLILRSQLETLRSLAICLELNWFVILVGNSGSGKTRVVQTLAQLSNKELNVLSVNSAMDAMEILGGFEQVDYNRHLEDLVIQTENVLFSVLRTIALESNSFETISKLLKKWERFKQIGKNDDHGKLTTLSAETGIFQLRLAALWDVLKTLSRFEYIRDKISSIENKMELLRRDVEKTGSLNSGGKFEWVDSVLIKCITEGKWLLVENVNLCSPAILDRLNGLLEPNGVLILGEKGVDNNGDLLTVQPHPDFRLFFTMDPQRGEISRAMRNRGVEIFLEPIDDNLNENIFDIMAILRHNGLFSYTIVLTLLKIHYTVCNLNIGLEQPSMSHIIHACFLLVQQCRRHGCPTKESFSSVCSDIYIKSRSLSYEQRVIITNVICEVLNKYEDLYADVPPFFLTLNTQKLQYNSAFDQILVQSGLLMLFVHLVSNTHDLVHMSSILFSDFPNIEDFKKNFQLQHLNMNNLLVYSLLKFYEASSQQDAPYRHFWWLEIVNYFQIKSQVRSLKTLNSTSESLMNLMLTENAVRNAEEEVLSENLENMKCNKLSLKMNFEILAHRCLKLESLFHDFKDFDITLEQYSVACVAGNIPTTNSIAELIASQFNCLATAFKEFFISLLDIETLKVDENMYGFFMKSFLAYLRFAGVQDLPFFSRSSGRVNNYLLNYIRMQFEWLVKQIRALIAEYDRTNGIRDVAEIIKLLELIESIEKVDDFAFSMMISFVKKLKRNMGQPELKEICPEVELSEKFSSWIWESHKNEENYAELRNYLCGFISTKHQELIDNEAEKESQILKTESDMMYSQYKFPIDIIPIFEAFFLRFQTLFRNVITERTTRIVTTESQSDFEESVSSQAPSVARQLCFTSPSCSSALVNVQNGNDFDIKWFMQNLKLVRSFSTFSYKQFLVFREAIRENRVDRDRDYQGALPFHYPLLTALSNEFLYISDEPCPVPSLYKPLLKNYRNYQVMLNDLKELLWKNSTFLSNSASSVVFNEKQNATGQLLFLISSIMKVLGLEITSNTITIEIVKQLQTELNNFILPEGVYENSQISMSLANLMKFLFDRFEDVSKIIKLIESREFGSDELQEWILIGQIWTLIGIIQFLLFSLFESVDPALKVQFKIMEGQDDLEFIQCRYAIEKLSTMLNGYDSKFPYLPIYDKWLKNVESKLKSLPENHIKRKKPEDYIKILRNVQQYRKTIGSSDTIYGLYSNIMLVLASLNGNDFENEMECKVSSLLNECRAWLNSSDKFVETLIGEFIEYADVVMPVVFAVSSMCYGVHVLSSCLLKSLATAKSNYVLSSFEKMKSVQEICVNLISFPRSLNQVSGTVYLSLTDSLVNLIAGDQVDVADYSNLIIRLTKSCLQEFSAVLAVYNVSNPDVRREIWSNVTRLLDRVVYIWRTQEERREEKKQNEDSLYIFKTRTLCDTPSEEEEKGQRLQAFFTPTLERDFGNLSNSPRITENGISDQETATSKKLEMIMTEEDMNAICLLHSEMTCRFTYADWTYCEAQSDQVKRSNIVESFCERYSIFAAVVNNYSLSLDEMMDVESLPGVLLTANKACTFDISDKLTDFYHTPDVKQVSLFYPVLSRIRNHCEELLKSWMDHPVLKSITSPVSRFLTGADVLLKKLHEWEDVACSAVSFATLYEELTGLIFMWRKMEISYWKNALELVAEKMKKNTSKWWFHLYSVCSQYINDETILFADLVTACQKFIETAAIGEFMPKLTLLRVFHCHYANQSKSARINELCDALWNLYIYYKQFNEQVSNYVITQAADVRKKLKDFVKITRWNDINYWSVMKTVEKTHEQLIKYVKEFQKVLEMPVTNAMCYIPGKSVQIEEVKNFEENVNLYVSNSLPNGGNRDSSRIFRKANRICRSSILNTSYHTLISALNESVGSVNEDIQILNRIDIDRAVEKEKQRSQAKNLLQQKRKIVADLFKFLTRLGVSYRTGIILSRTQNYSVNFAYSRPFDAHQLYSRLAKSTADEYLISQWFGCEESFLNSIAKQSQLKIALQKPHQDLGPQVCDRVRGFANHLLDCEINYRNKLVNAVLKVRKMKLFENVLNELCEEVHVCEAEALQLKNQYLRVIQEGLYFFKQFLLLMDCCPEDGYSSLLTIPDIKLTKYSGNMLSITKGSSMWTEIYNRIQNHSQTLRSLLLKFSTGIVNFKMYDQLVTAAQSIVIFQEYEKLKEIEASLGDIKICFGPDFNVFHAKLNVMQTTFSKLVHDIENFRPKVPNQEQNLDLYEKRIQKLTHSILLPMQKMFKKYKNVEPADQDKEEIKEGHLKELLMKSLDDDINLLNTDVVRKSVRRLAKDLMKNSHLSCDTRKTLLIEFLPLLNQYCLLFEFIVTQYLATFKVTTNLCCSLLSLFIELTTQGFRVPPDLLEEEKEEKGSKEKGGMGLEDGEGIKDVSEEIESQDQLEGAQKSGEEEKRDDNECQEEKNGIEMSDDFGGKSQNVEKEDRDDENSEDEAEELEKEMGETGEDAETLDQEVWQTDSENEDDDDGDDKEGGGEGAGEQIGDKEMGAKDERTKEYEEQIDDKNSNGREDKQKEINEMEDQQKDDDQIDSYHGKQNPLPEPEALDLPDDFQLDEGEAKEDETNEENPFDIDAMKELMPPEDREEKDDGEDNKDQEEKELTENDVDDTDDDDGDVGSKRDEEKLGDDDHDDKTEIENDTDDGGKKDELKNGDEPKSEEEPKENAKEKPGASEDKPSEVAAEPSKDNKNGSKDVVGEMEEECNEQLEDEQNLDHRGVENQGVGQADDSEKDTSRGHSSSTNEGSQSREKGTQEQKRKLKPGESDINRALAEANEPFKKRLKTIEALQEEEEGPDAGENNEIEEREESSLYQHIKEAEGGTSEAVDAATKDQAERQPILDDDNGKETTNDDEIDIDESEDEEMKEDAPQQKSEKIEKSEKSNADNKTSKDVEIQDVEMQSKDIKIDGEYIETMTAERGADTTFHTREDQENEQQTQHLSLEYIESLKNQVHEHLSNWTQIPAMEEATAAWEMFSTITSNLSQELSEQLRLVLEPTQASRLKGDFRTGRRINMRKVIPYIASQFRKDKIWLRRTKPSKREYQIILAIDNSSSMADNHCQELAFESVALVSKALSLIEAGELGVISFGKNTRVLHPLGEIFSSQTGARLIRDFTFDECETKYAEAVHIANGIFLTRYSLIHGSKVARLLVIISDGRNVFCEGVSAVKSAVRAAKQAGIFIVFIVVENPKNPKCNNSILDIKSVPTFTGGKNVEIRNYIESFPFPFYLVLRDINKLPAVLAEALQQWFDLVTNTSE